MSETVPGARGTELPVEADWDAVFIDGEWRDVEHRERIEDVNPAAGETFARVPE